jgi:hypothetical protein
MTKLTKIEQLDQRFPGLADDVVRWFSQGVSVEEIPRLLFAKYNIFMSASPVAKFRSRRRLCGQRSLHDPLLKILESVHFAPERSLSAYLAAKLQEDVN